MAELQLPLDVYTLRARLAPAFVTALPVGFTVVAAYSGNVGWWSPFWVVLTAFGGMFLIAELGRDAGKKRESALFADWGGKPTTQMLRRNTARNEALQRRFRDKLLELDPSIELPSRAKEEEDPSGADEMYDAAVHVLRERTRDRTQFPLVFQALCEYGFRRNLWGLKPIGITFSVIGLVVISAIAFVRTSGNLTMIGPMIIAGFLLNAALFLIWWVRIRPSWVKTAACSYSERLVASLERLCLGQGK